MHLHLIRTLLCYLSTSRCYTCQFPASIVLFLSKHLVSLKKNWGSCRWIGMARMQIVHFSDCLVQNVKQGLQRASFLMPANLFLSPTFTFCTNQDPLKTIVWNEISFKMQPLILRKSNAFMLQSIHQVCILHVAWIGAPSTHESFPTEPLADFCSSSTCRCHSGFSWIPCLLELQSHYVCSKAKVCVICGDAHFSTSLPLASIM